MDESTCLGALLNQGHSAGWLSSKCRRMFALHDDASAFSLASSGLQVIPRHVTFWQTAGTCPLPIQCELTVLPLVLMGRFNTTMNRCLQSLVQMTPSQPLDCSCHVEASPDPALPLPDRRSLWLSFALSYALV